jgi:hypothetical protein
MLHCKIQKEAKRDENLRGKLPTEIEGTLFG